MGTKIQANTFLREYHSVIDLDGSISNGVRSLYHENQIVKKDQNPDLFPSRICENGYLGYDQEKVRQTILEHESIFRHQLQELHRLYARQQELVNEIKWGEIKKDDVKEEKSQSSSLFLSIPPEDAKRTWNSRHSSSHSMPGPLSSFLENKSVPIFPPAQDARSLRNSEPWLSKSYIFPRGTYDLGIPANVYMEKQMQERFSKLPGCENSYRNGNHQTSYDRDTKLSLSSVQTSQHNADALAFNFCFKRASGDFSITKPPDGIPGSLKISRGEASASSCSNLNLTTQDFFQDSLDGMNGVSSSSILGFRNERSGKEHLSDDYAGKMRFDKHSSVGNFCSDKPTVLTQPLLSEPRKELLNCPLDIGTSVSHRKRKLFGVEISEGNDAPIDAVCGMLSTLDPRVGHHQENHRVVSFQTSSWIDNSFMQNLELGKTNVNDNKDEKSRTDLRGEMSSQEISFCHSDMSRKWLQGCSSNLMKVPHWSAESEPKKCFKNLDDMKSRPEEVLKKDSENSKGGLPWFLRNSQVNGDLKGNKSSYFMNLDSLQSSQKFFRKTETANGAFPTLKQKKEISAPMAARDVEGRTNEANDGIGAKKILGFLISDSDRKVEDVPRNQLENKDLVLHKRLNSYISDLKHHIDLNLSLDKEDAPSAPSLPTAIVKIATTEIDLEAPAIIESETDASPEEVQSRKTDVSPGKSKDSFEECDKIAAEAILAFSLSEKKNLVDDDATPEAESTDCLKWFVEIVSSQCGEEEPIPDGMDYFEFMTLKLEDTKEECYHYKPVILNNPSDDETGNTMLSKRARRGQSRRGRQRKDFQRDVLPGLVTLSRLEVAEDLQAFDELLKAKGSPFQLGLSQRSSTRNGRGRKRSGGLTASPTRKAICSTPRQPPICQLGERSLTGWGKRTRRLPRQRCTNAFLSFAVKC